LITIECFQEEGKVRKKERKLTYREEDQDIEKGIVGTCDRRDPEA